MGRPENPRKQPRQARSRGTVDAILVTAARVFERPLVRRVLGVHRAGPGLQRVLHTERPWLERAAADSEASLRLFAATREWLVGRQDVAVRDPDVAAMTVLRVIEALVHGAVLEPGGADDEALTAVIAEVVEGYLVLPR